MGLRGFDRKIAILDKYDTKLQCGQCHVEYNCNDGYDPKNPDTSKRPSAMTARGPTTSPTRMSSASMTIT